MNRIPRRKHSHVLREHLPLKGARLVDIGCGDGALVRLMTREGARVTGIECSESQLARARAAEPAGEEDYLPGRAEDLPFEADSLDAAVFFNSLHHVPVESQAKALEEAARVVKPGGVVYVQEPIAAGAHFELMRPIEDETFVRAKAQEAIAAAAQGPALRAELEAVYDAPIRRGNFEEFKAELIAVDAGRRAGIEAAETTLKAAFEAAGEVRDGATWFDQPSRLSLLRKVG